MNSALIFAVSYDTRHKFRHWRANTQCPNLWRLYHHITSCFINKINISNSFYLFHLYMGDRNVTVHRPCERNTTPPFFLCIPEEPSGTNWKIIFEQFLRLFFIPWKGIMPLKRPIAGRESCGAGFFLYKLYLILL